MCMYFSQEEHIMVYLPQSAGPGYKGFYNSFCPLQFRSQKISLPINLPFYLPNVFLSPPSHSGTIYPVPNSTFINQLHLCTLLHTGCFGVFSRVVVLQEWIFFCPGILQTFLKCMSDVPLNGMSTFFKMHRMLSVGICL